jgi:Domain of unknown function (DUF4157)
MHATLQTQAKKPPAMTPVMNGMLQRKCACGGTPGPKGECKECSKKRLELQRKASNQQEPSEVPPIVHEVMLSSGQPLDKATRNFFEPRFGHDFSGVRVHTDLRAAESARAVNALAYTVGHNVVFGDGGYAPSSSEGKRLIAHELAHVVQQSSGPRTTPLRVVSESDPSERQGKQAEAFAHLNATGVMGVQPTPSGWAVMRDLAQEPLTNTSPQPELTPAQIQAAIRYNRASYDQSSIRLIQDIVGAPDTGRFDEITIRLIALIQHQFGLVPVDGKVGPNTYDLLIGELQAEGTAPGTCLTMFQLVGPQPLTFFRTSPSAGVINSRTEIHALFDPRCNCSDYEYRQFISGHVELLEASQPGVTPPHQSGCAILDSVLPDMWVWNMDACFQVPGGGLSRTWKEDGDTAVPIGAPGRRYGHRTGANPVDRRDRYSPDRATGCAYDAFDVPDLAPVPATSGDSGDVYDWEMRFRGVIQRSDGTVVSEKWWSIITGVTIP